MRLTLPGTRKPVSFIILRADQDGERVPFTIAAADPEKGTVTIIYQVVGASTRKLMALEEGDELADFAGPLGRPSEIEGENDRDHRRRCRLRNRSADGQGIPPMPVKTSQRSSASAIRILSFSKTSSKPFRIRTI